MLGGHGLFTWGDTQRDCYLNTITIIDQLGQFVMEHVEKKGADDLRRQPSAPNAGRTIASGRWIIFPFIRGRVSSRQRMIGSFSDLPEVLRFINSTERARSWRTSAPVVRIILYARKSARCMFRGTPNAILPACVKPSSGRSRLIARNIKQYYEAFAQPDSPAMRDVNPTVVLIPGIGMFSFGKNKTEARITGEFYVNAIHVMEGASALASAARLPANSVCRRLAPPPDTEAFTVYSNYVALPPSEAFRIEYWLLEEAKLRRQPPEKELSRRVALIVGGGKRDRTRVGTAGGAARSAHVIIADRDAEQQRRRHRETAKSSEAKKRPSALRGHSRPRGHRQRSCDEMIAIYGGIDILINTAAIFPSSPDGRCQRRAVGGQRST